MNRWHIVGKCLMLMCWLPSSLRTVFCLRYAPSMIRQGSLCREEDGTKSSEMTKEVFHWFLHIYPYGFTSTTDPPASHNLWSNMHRPWIRRNNNSWQTEHAKSSTSIVLFLANYTDKHFICICQYLITHYPLPSPCSPYINFPFNLSYFAS